MKEKIVLVAGVVLIVIGGALYFLMQQPLPFLKHQYRTSFGTTCDILQACTDADIDVILISRVSQKQTHHTMQS